MGATQGQLGVTQGHNVRTTSPNNDEEPPALEPRPMHLLESNEADDMGQMLPDNEDSKEEEIEDVTPDNRKYHNEMRKIDTFFNHTLNADGEPNVNTIQWNSHEVYSSAIQSDPGVPKNPKEALRNPAWKNSMGKELTNFIDRKSWRLIR